MKALTDVYAAFAPMREEWDKNNAIPLSFVLLESTILASKTKITSLEDIKGMKIRGVGWSGRAFRMLGSTPVAIGAPEIYTSIQRGVFPAADSTPLRYYVAAKIFEVAPYLTDPGMGLFISESFAMNKDTWSILPQDYRDAFKKAHESILAKEVDIANKANEGYIKTLMNSKAQPVALSPKEKAKWRDICVPGLFGEWVKEVSKNGLPGQEWLDAYRAALKKHSGKSHYKDPFYEWVRQYKQKQQ
jgi:TRAP-type C4-dicarboxylate transport system substrate-binding protein